MSTLRMKLMLNNFMIACIRKYTTVSSTYSMTLIG